MSLLLDARKKSQQAQSSLSGGRTELSLENHHDPVVPKPDPLPIENARSTGQNLFAAKSPASGHTFPKRNLLLALGGTVLLLATGAGYWWYSTAITSNTTPLHPISTPPRPSLTQPGAMVAPAQNSPAPASNAIDPGPPGTQQTIENAGTSASPVTSKMATAVLASPSHQPAASDVPRRDRHNQPQPGSVSLRIERPQAELVDPVLSSAYQAYRDGRIAEAQQLYLSAYKNDARNTDALLGLAAIAQQRGDQQAAAQYYSQVLTLDPRNALANAGMSALSNDANNESRLKILLSEQGNSAALHFALGNLYAGQARWGEAQQAFFNAYTLESESAEFAFNLGVSLDHLGQGKLAAQHYQRALQLDQSHRAGIDHEFISRRAQELSR